MKKSAEHRFWQRVLKTPQGCWEWQGELTWAGYGRFILNGRKVRAHRFSYVIHKGPIPDGLIIRHSCENRRCVNPDHLSIGTYHDNAQDRIQKYGHYGRPPNAKLTTADVIFIRQAYTNRTHTLVALGKQFDVSMSAINAAAKGTSFRDVPMPQLEDVSMSAPRAGPGS